MGRLSMSICEYAPPRPLIRTSLAPQFWHVFSTHTPVWKRNPSARLTALAASISPPSTTLTNVGDCWREVACWLAVTTTCPNATQLRQRFGYRIVKARWSGKGSAQYDLTLQVIGNDDISIVNNITSLITKEGDLSLRSINIDTGDGLFKADITVRLGDTTHMQTLIKKLRGVKGVRAVSRK